MTAANRAYVVIAAYNEAQVVGRVVEELTSVFPHVIVVNDGSTDATADVLRQTRAITLSHAINLGQGAALQTGISYALRQGAEWIITFDADGQHRMEDALVMLTALQADGGDVVVGSRFLGSAIHLPPLRRMVLKLAVVFSNLTTGTRLTDAHNGLRVLSRRAAAALDIEQNGMAHASEIISQMAKAKMDIREWPVTIQYTAYSLKKGQSVFNALNILLELALGKIVK